MGGMNQVSNRKMVWAYSGKKPISIQKAEKERILDIVEKEIERTEKVKQKTSRMEIRAGRIYIYELYEPMQMEGVVYTKPLVDGKYLEIPFMRITIYNKGYTDCTLDYQRYNDQWMTIDSGTLTECIEKAENSEWFE